MHCPSAGGGESGNGIAHVAFRHVAVRKSSALALGQPPYRNCQPAMPRLCRTAYSRSCRTASISPHTVQLQPPVRHGAKIARTALQLPHNLGCRCRAAPVAANLADAARLTDESASQTASGASAAKRLYQHISYRQHDRADRKGDKPLAFREFLNLRQHIKEFAP